MKGIFLKHKLTRMVKIGKETTAKHLVRGGDGGRGGNDFICPDKASTKLAVEKAKNSRFITESSEDPGFGNN